MGMFLTTNIGTFVTVNLIRVLTCIRLFCYTVQFSYSFELALDIVYIES